MLFQISAARRLAESWGLPIVANMTFTREFIGGSTKLFVQELLQELNIKCADEKTLFHGAEILKARVAGIPIMSDWNARRLLEEIAPRDRALITGYFQNWTLFREDIIRLLPTLRNLLHQRVGESAQGNRGAIHLRLGDYSSLQSIYGDLSDTYISASLEKLAPGPPAATPPIRVFSNDLELAAKRLRDFPYEFEFVAEPDPVAALVALSHSNWIIGSNSTFSWWAAAVGDFAPLSLPTPYLLKRTLNSKIDLNSPNVLPVSRT